MDEFDPKQFADKSSELVQWPIKLWKAPIVSPYYHHAHLLVAADCSAFAYPGFHDMYAKGKVTYKVIKYVTKGAKGKVKVATSGKVTVKKGTKKGVYVLKVKVTAPARGKYAKTTKTVKLKIRVK